MLWVKVVFSLASNRLTKFLPMSTVTVPYPSPKKHIFAARFPEILQYISKMVPSDNSYLDELNDIQREAVTTIDGPVMIVAGPGSGKTRVLTYRIAHLLRQPGVKPWDILSLTFTNKSAKEMKERIGKVVGEEKANRIWAGTFHSVFSKILRTEASHIGYPSSFTIYDTDDAKSVIREIVKTMNLDKTVYKDGAIYGAISMAKNNLVSPVKYKMDVNRLTQDKQKKMPFIYEIYERYVAQCQKNGAMDFDDLLTQTYYLFEKHPAILSKYQSKFKYVMVDEFQDTNPLQSAIVEQLVKYPNSPQNICVVGDDAQSIYAFRGATIQNIFDFQKSYSSPTSKPKVLKLEQNYRSTGPIVAAANEVIKNNRKQIQKTIYTQQEEGQPIAILRTMSDEEEAKRVADTIVEHKTRHHLRNSELAVLYRTNAQSRAIEEALTHYRIAYRVYGGQSFFQRKEIKDMVSYLRLVVNHSDNEALKRIINYPKRGIGDTTMDKLAASAASAGITLWEACKEASKFGIPHRTAAAIDEFCLMIDGFNKYNLKHNAYEVAVQVSRAAGIINELKQDTTVEGIGRLDNLNSLLDGIKAFVENDVEDLMGVDDEANTTDATPPTALQPHTLEQYLQNIALLTDADNDDEGAETVKLMSVHAAKGLEFRSVFVVGCEEKLFPSMMATMSDDPISAMDEERRLFYVAITRAKEFLTLTYANSRIRFGKVEYNDKSRFLDEISPRNTRVEAQPVGRSTVSGLPKPGSVPTFKPVQVEVQVPQGGFVAAPITSLAKGQIVLHERFGKGNIKDIDGGPDNRVATILFEDVAAGEKRIMLKYARLMIIG